VKKPETGDARFPKALRLLKKRDFDRTFAEGVTVRNGRMKLVVRTNGFLWSRIGLIVGRRYGNAVERNRLRRHLREAFRLDRAALPPGLDIVVLPFRNSFRLEDLRQSFRSLCAKAASRVAQNAPPPVPGADGPAPQEEERP